MLSVLPLLFFAVLVTARTDLSGCVSSETVAYGGDSLLWYVPGTGEICDLLDCGGGRAPPKQDVPGCPLYSGTASYSPSYLSVFKNEPASQTTYVSLTNSGPSAAMITGSQIPSIDSSATTTSSIGPSSSESGCPFVTEDCTASQSSSRTTSSTASATSSASSPASTGNAGAFNSVNSVSSGLVGAAAIGVAFAL